MTNKTALQIFCENLEHNMSIETFSFYNLLKRDCLEIEKQQIIEAAKFIPDPFKINDYYNQTYNNLKMNNDRK